MIETIQMFARKVQILDFDYDYLCMFILYL